MKEKMNLLLKEIEGKLSTVNDLKDLNNVKVEYLSKKGPISELSNHMKDLAIEKKKEFGKALNDFRNEVNNLFASPGSE